MAKVNWECKQTKQRRLLNHKSENVLLAWVCYCQKLPAAASECTFKSDFTEEYRFLVSLETWKGDFTGQPEYSLEVSPQKWCLALQGLTQPTPVSQPHPQMHDRVQAGHTGQELEGASLGRKLWRWCLQGAYRSWVQMTTLLEVFFPHHNALKAERPLKTGTDELYFQQNKL